LFETEGTYFEEVSRLPQLLHRTGPPPTRPCPGANHTRTAWPFLSVERLATDLSTALEMKPETFKQFLFSLSTHKTKHKDFKRINERFSKEPFRFGELSFFLDPSTREIEIMIERSEVRLPLGRMGSGLQQILFLIGSILSKRKKIVGIEEIELNLSPIAQKDVFEMVKAMVFKQPRLLHQVLVTSHSPYFQNRDDVKYYEVTYDQGNSKTEVRAASKHGMRKYFGRP
jgi:predicted ATP-dependent endonuclease of OLD family